MRPRHQAVAAERTWFMSSDNARKMRAGKRAALVAMASMLAAAGTLGLAGCGQKAEPVEMATVSAVPAQAASSKADAPHRSSASDFSVSSRSSHRSTTRDRSSASDAAGPQLVNSGQTSNPYDGMTSNTSLADPAAGTAGTASGAYYDEATGMWFDPTTNIYYSSNPNATAGDVSGMTAGTAGVTDAVPTPGTTGAITTSGAGLDEATPSVSYGSGDSGSQTAYSVSSRGGSGTVAPDAGTTTTGGTATASSRARQYLGVQNFSRSGLISQLEYDGYSEADATAAADALNLDWTDQARQRAAYFAGTQQWTRDQMVSQLEYEGWSADDAAAGADSVNYGGQSSSVPAEGSAVAVTPD